jgi:hypothetical protein
MIVSSEGVLSNRIIHGAEPGEHGARSKEECMTATLPSFVQLARFTRFCPMSHIVTSAKGIF